MNVATFIPKSPDRISMTSLAAKIGRSERNTRKLINRARRSGEIIGSDRQGYYLPDGSEELSRHYREAYRRAISTLASLKRERKQLKAAGIDVLNLEGKRQKG